MATPVKTEFLFKSYGRSRLFLFLAMLASFISVGFFAPYWHKAVANMIAGYEALLYNDGLYQEFLWYPMYMTPQLLGIWYWIAHIFGFLQEYKFSLLPAVTTASEFDAIWQRLVAWGYVYSFAIGSLYVFLSIILIRRFTGVWQVAVLAGVALAFSDGIALGYRILRSEVLCSALVSLSLLLTLIAAQSPRNSRRFLYLGLAGLLAGLALTEKVQALIPLLTFPVVALAFGREEPDTPTIRMGTGFRIAALCVLSLAIVVPTIDLVQQGMTSMVGSYVHPIAQGQGPHLYRSLSGNLSGIYQWLLFSYVAFSMLLYAWIWRVRPIDAVSGLLAVFVGLALGFLALYWHYNIIAVIAVVNPVEHLLAVSALPGRSLTELSIDLIEGLGRTLAAHTFFLHPSHRPTLLIEWLSIYAGFLLWRRGEKHVALQISVLLLAAISIDVLFNLRGGVAEGVSTFYMPFTDPLIVLAGAIALTQFYRELLSLKAQRLILGCMVVYVVWGHFEPFRATYGDKPKRKICAVAAHFMQRVSIPHCQDFDRMEETER
jgi:hypothetical protein